MAKYRNGNGSDAVINRVIYVAGAAIVLVVGWVFWRAWSDITATSYRLRKDQWACSQSHIRTVSVMEGKYGHVSSTHQTICDQYTRISPAP